MDGWETIHLIRNVHKSDVKIGIISANAFDKNLENDSGIRDKDFILKPVNLFELIYWLGERLELEWINKSDVVEAKAIDAPYQLPPEATLKELLEMINLGYLVGVRQLIKDIELQELACNRFINEVSDMAAKFQLSKMKKFVEEQLENVW